MKDELFQCQFCQANGFTKIELCYHELDCQEKYEMDERLSLLFNIPKEELWK